MRLAGRSHVQWCRPRRFQQLAHLNHLCFRIFTCQETLSNSLIRNPISNILLIVDTIVSEIVSNFVPSSFAFLRLQLHECGLNDLHIQLGEIVDMDVRPE